MAIETMEGLVDFLTIYNMMELFNVVCTKTYLGGLSKRERYDYVEARRICREIFRWWDGRYYLIGTGMSATRKRARLHDIQSHYLDLQINALICYRNLADSYEDSGDTPACNSEELVFQLGEALGEKYVADLQSRLNASGADYSCPSFEWPQSFKYEIRRKPATMTSRLISFKTFTCYIPTPFFSCKGPRGAAS